MGMIQIRNVPPELHRKLKARAADAGMSLSDYLLRMAEREAETLTVPELAARIRSRPKARLARPPSETLREIRDAM